ncbi:unnamed protein product [Sphagnum tenellum]
MNWGNPAEVLALPMAQDWAKPFRERVALQTSFKAIRREAQRATIEAITRRLRTLKWRRKYTSNASYDGRADSRYYVSPHFPPYQIRISNHPFPNGKYYGSAEYLITTSIIEQYNVAGFVALILREENAANRVKKNPKKNVASDYKKGVASGSRGAYTLGHQMAPPSRAK